MKWNIRIEKKYIVDFLLLFVIVLITYFTSLFNGFVYDDFAAITKNPLLQNPTKWYLIFTKEYFLFSYEMTYRPLVTISYLFDYFIWRLNPFGYHLTNIIIHILNVLLIYLLSIKITRDRVFSIFNGVLWGILAINSEAVNGISYREDLLTMLFFMFAFLLYIWEKEKGNFLLVIVVGSSYFLALLSKEMAVTFPIIVILFDILFYRDTIKKSIKSYILFVFLTLIYLMLRFLISLGLIQEKAQYVGGNVFVSILLTSKIFLKYILLTLFPIRLSAEYVINPPENLLNIGILISIIIHLAVIIFSISYVKKDKLVTFFIWFFYLSLLPVANIIPIWNPMAERYMYLPSLALSFLICSFLFRYIKKSVGMGILVIIILFNIAIVLKQNRIWKDEISLWENAVKVSPDSGRARVHLGEVYHHSGLIKEAIREYLRVIKISPDYYWAYNNLGQILLEENEIDEAIKLFRKTIELNKNFIYAYNNLGHAYYLKKDYEKAELAYQLTIEINKYYLDPYINLGILYIETKKFKEAKDICLRALDINYNLGEVHTNLGIIYHQEGNLGEAEKEFKIAIQVDKNRTDGYFNLGLFYQKNGDDDKAEGYFKRAIELDKRSEKPYISLATIYKKRGKVQEALQLYETALDIDPKNTIALIELGIIYFDAGQHSKAKKYFENALEIDKNSEIAKSFLQKM